MFLYMHDIFFFFFFGGGGGGGGNQLMLGPSLGRKLRVPHGIITHQMKCNAADKGMHQKDHCRVHLRGYYFSKC